MMNPVYVLHQDFAVSISPYFLCCFPSRLKAINGSNAIALAAKHHAVPVSHSWMHDAINGAKNMFSGGKWSSTETIIYCS